jgi:hypothetical protein
MLDIAIDHRAAQGAGPEMFDVQLRIFLAQFARQEPLNGLPLVIQEQFAALVDQATHRDHRKPLVKLDRGQRIARIGADECLLETRVRNRFRGGGEPRAKLHAGGAHFQIGQDRFAPTDAAGDEHRHVADVGQDLLCQHVQADRADMAPCLGALDDQRIGAGADQPSGEHQRRGERDQFGATILHRAHRAAWRNAAGQHDVRDTGLQRHADQVVELGMQRDQVDAERLRGQRLRCRDFPR